MIRASGRIYVHTEVQCGSGDRIADLRAAARAFYEQHGTWPDEIEDPETGDGEAVMAACEGCGQAIFLGEEYAADDEDGIYTCAGCLRKLEQEHAAAGALP